MTAEAKARAAKRRKVRRKTPLAVADLDKLRAAVSALAGLVQRQNDQIARISIEVASLRTVCVISPQSLPELAREISHRLSDHELRSLGWSPLLTTRKAIIHWVRSEPVNEPAEQRGFACGARFDHATASSYRDQVTCEACLLTSHKT